MSSVFLSRSQSLFEACLSGIAAILYYSTAPLLQWVSGPVGQRA